MANRKNPRVVSFLNKMNSNQNPHVQSRIGNKNVIFLNGGVGIPEDGDLSTNENMSLNEWIKYPTETLMPPSCASAPPSNSSNYQNQFYPGEMSTQPNTRQPGNFNTGQNNSMFYQQDNTGGQSSCFYQQQQNFLYDQNTMKSCELVSGNVSNFYGGENFYSNVQCQNPDEYLNEINGSYSHHQQRQYNVGHVGNGNFSSQNYFNSYPKSYGPPFNQGIIRRNSIESFSTETGEGYQTKYANNEHQYIVPPLNIKRETTTGNFNRRSNNGSGINVGYFFGSNSANGCSQARIFPSAGNIESFNHQQQQSFESFKSCSFEQDRGDELNNSHHHGQSQHLKAGSVKQRSLSLSCTYPRSDSVGHFPNESAVNPFETNTNVNVINSSLPIVPDNLTENINFGSKIPDLTSGQSIKSESEGEFDDREEEEEEGQLVIESDIKDQDQIEASSSEMSNSEFMNLNFSLSPNKIEERKLKKNIDSPELSDYKDDSKNEDNFNYELISTTTTEIKKEEILDDCSNMSNSLPSPVTIDKKNIVNDLNSLSISTSETEDSLNCYSFPKTFDPISANSPQKISKRSFSEADKDLVINTSAITAAVTAFGNMTSSLTSIRVPSGWRRQIILSTTNKMIIYISPSGTKLKSLEELKNYICSDGTCKCGLSCPLLIEHCFNFDPKVANICEDEESQMDFNELQESKCSKSDSSIETSELLCNHKKKIPKSQDSPLISSTRDDLGDFGEGERSPITRKRKIYPATRSSESRNKLLKDENGASVPSTKDSISTSNFSIVVPFSQQSPDTTTQIPHTEMSPVSSISSETSTKYVRTFGGTRSSSTTPTPVLTPNRGKSATPPLVLSQVGFSWPTTPSSQSSQAWSNPNSSNDGSPTNAEEKKILPQVSIQKSRKIGKQSPNELTEIDPSRQQQQNQQQIQLTQNKQANSTTLPIGASQLNQNSNPNLSFFPISSTVGGEGDVSNPFSSMNLNTGYSISPIPSTNATRVNSGTVQFVNFNANNFPLQRVVTMANPANTLLHQSLPSSITISMVGTEATNLQNFRPQINENELSISPPNPSLTIKVKDCEGKNVKELNSIDSEKSPLQLVQDVVDRFQNSKESEDKSKLNFNDESNETDSVGKSPNTSQNSISKPATNNSSMLSNVDKTESPKVEEEKKHVIVTTTCASPISTSVPIMDTGSTCTTSTVSITSSPTSLLTVSQPTTSMVIRTSQHDQKTTSQFITTSANTTNSIRYPIFQTIQPFFLNSGGNTGSHLIISPQHTQDPNVQQSGQHQSLNIFEPPGGHNGNDGQIQLHQTMLLDPSVCGVSEGPKKKKKRLSKKQQQQQAQMQLQQHLLLQSLQQQAQQQQAAAASIPLTIFPPFNLGPQSFSLQSLQPMNMNFFPTPTILTLPNLILNPADGTLFIQPSAPTAMSTTPGSQTVTITGQTMKLGQFPITNTSTITSIQNHIAPKKDLTSTPITINSSDGLNISDIGSDDSRQNAIPDSSTNDPHLNAINAQSIFCSKPSIVKQIPTQFTLNLANKKISLSKSKVVSSSSGNSNAIGKRVFTQKQILPKIDSTTPSVENS